MIGVWPMLIYQAVIAYGALGVAAALAFLLFGLDRIDHGAAGAYAFRPLLLPGLILLWPVVLLRWRFLCR
jgi:hypothetical protein